MSRTARIVLGLLTLATAVALAIGGYWLTLVFGEDVEFRRGDLAYRLLVGGEVDDFPIIGAAASDAVYQYDAQDGPAPMRLTLAYVSRETPESVIAGYEAACGARGFAPLAPENSDRGGSAGCLGKDYQIRINAKPAAAGSDVIVLFEGNLEP
jgi:hypothetical protein